MSLVEHVGSNEWEGDSKKRRRRLAEKARKMEQQARIEQLRYDLGPWDMAGWPSTQVEGGFPKGLTDLLTV